MPETLMATICTIGFSVFIYDALRTGKVGYFLQAVYKEENPFFYWALVVILLICLIGSFTCIFIPSEKVTAWITHSILRIPTD